MNRGRGRGRGDNGAKNVGTYSTPYLTEYSTRVHTHTAHTLQNPIPLCRCFDMGQYDLRLAEPEYGKGDCQIPCWGDFVPELQKK